MKKAEGDMSLMHYDAFNRKAGAVDKMECKVCGETCDVERNRFGPTSYASAMAKQKIKHDHFSCPHINKPWHEQALGLVQEINDSHSPSLKKIMKKDLVKIIEQKKVME